MRCRYCQVLIDENNDSRLEAVCAECFSMLRAEYLADWYSKDIEEDIEDEEEEED